MRETYNKLVARRGDEYYFLGDIFKHSDDFHGATGHVLRPVSKEEYDDRTSTESLLDSLEDLWRIQVEDGGLTQGLNEWVNDAIAIDGPEELAFDTSYFHGDEWEQLRRLGFSEEEYPVFEWVSGGRLFNKDSEYDEVYDQKLLNKINKAEG